MKYAIAFSEPVSDYTVANQKWYVSLDSKLVKSMVVSIAFSDKKETTDEIIKRVKNPITRNDVSAVLLKNEQYWDDDVSRNPNPGGQPNEHGSGSCVTNAE